MLLPRIKRRGNVVALRKESVDRNIFALYAVSLDCVALRKESVDRNHLKPIMLRMY